MSPCCRVFFFFFLLLPFVFHSRIVAIFMPKLITFVGGIVEFDPLKNKTLQNILRNCMANHFTVLNTEMSLEKYRYINHHS